MRQKPPDGEIHGPYPLGAAADETARLVRQSGRYRAEATSLFDRIGVRPGWHVADVGCGPLGVLDLLADRVGPTGSVLGLDFQERMVAAARDRHRGLGNIRVERADIQNVQPDTRLDLVHARLLLVNIPRPDRAVANMARMVRPGGYVALQEVDWHTWSTVPASAAYDDLRDRLARVWSGDVHLGRRLRSVMASAGLVDIEVGGTAGVVDAGQDQHSLLLYFAGLARERLLRDGMPAAEYEELACAVRDHLAQPAHYVVEPLLFQAWGRVS